MNLISQGFVRRIARIEISLFKRQPLTTISQPLSTTNTPSIRHPSFFDRKSSSSRANSSMTGINYPGSHAKGLRVLSIQSHVVQGYVGNKCAIFPLQLLGFDVDPIYSVQFSNHTGYPTFKGQVFDGNNLMEIVKGLEENGLLSAYTHMLTGYIGSPSLLDKLVDTYNLVRAHSGPGLTYVCDPVLGDEGRLYVQPAMVDLYRTKVLPIATVVTPNQFEAELLSGRNIVDEASALAAMDELHAMGPSTVILTSAELEGDSSHIVCLASSYDRPADSEGASPSSSDSEGRRVHGGRRTLVKISVPKIQAYFTGTGDLFTALLLGYLRLHPDDLRLAVEKAVNALQVVLRGTAEAGGQAALDKGTRDAAVCRARELRLVQYQRAIVDPPVDFKAEIWEPTAGGQTGVIVANGTGKTS